MMGKLSAKLRSVSGPTSKGIAHWCPGCKGPHVIYTEYPGHAVWTWNGDVDKPTTTPSVRCFTTDPDGKNQRTLCHYFLTDGNIVFCADCPHEFSGKTVPIPDWT